jgi:lysophospholipase L1-like esterase
MATEISFVPGNLPGKIVCPESKKSYKKPVVIADPYEVPAEEDLDSILSEKFLVNKTQKLLEHSKVKESHVPSIAIWGDSHMAAAFLTDELINILGLKKENVRSRFISPTMARAGVRLPIKQYCQSKSWSFDYAYRNNDQLTYLKSLAKLRTNKPNSYLWVDFTAPESGDKLKKLKIKFSSSLKTKLAISLDDGGEKIVDVTPSGNIQELVLASTSGKFSLLKIKLLEGQISIDGFIPTYSDAPLLYLDLMAIPGATINGWHNFDQNNSVGQDLIDYDLAILSYGTNEGNDPDFDTQKYAKNLETALIKFKASNPNSACLLIGPTDRGVLVKRSGKQKNSKSKKKMAKVDLLKYSLIHQKISTIQNTLSAQYGCTFWSWQDAMGGVGGAYRWLKGNPKLMANDLTHLTINGYQRSASILNADVGIKKALGFE